MNPFTPHNLDMLKAEDHEGSADGDDPVLVVDDKMVRMLCALSCSSMFMSCRENLQALPSSVKVLTSPWAAGSMGAR